MVAEKGEDLLDLLLKSAVPIDTVCGSQGICDKSLCDNEGSKNQGKTILRNIEIARAVRDAISPDMPMMANIGDFGTEQAEELLNSGFQAAYHVFRGRF